MKIVSPSARLSLGFSMRDRPWQTVTYGRELNEASLARRLKPYEIEPHTIRSFAAHLPRFSCNIQDVMLIQLRRLWPRAFATVQTPDSFADEEYITVPTPWIAGGWSWPQ